MAKKALKIEKFNGGINSDTDSRDVSEGQLTSLDNASVDELGKVRVSGGLNWKEYLSSLVATQNEAQLRFPGTGLYSFPVDYLFSGNNHTCSLYSKRPRVCCYEFFVTGKKLSIFNKSYFNVRKTLVLFRK